MTLATIMRAAFLTTAVASAPRLAIANEAISGQWRADLGHNVIIVMDVLVDNHWASETVQDDKVDGGTWYSRRPRRLHCRSRMAQSHGARAGFAESARLRAAAPAV